MTPKGLKSSVVGNAAVAITREHRSIPVNIDWAKIGVPGIAEALAGCSMNLASEKWLDDEHKKQRERVDWIYAEEDAKRDLEKDWEKLQLRTFFRSLEKLAERGN